MSRRLGKHGGTQRPLVAQAGVGARLGGGGHDAVGPQQRPAQVQVEVVPLAAIENLGGHVAPRGDAEATGLEAGRAEDTLQHGALNTAEAVVVHVQVLQRVAAVAERVIGLAAIENLVEVIETGARPGHLLEQRDGEVLPGKPLALEECGEPPQVGVIRLALRRDARRYQDALLGRTGGGRVISIMNKARFIRALL